MGSTEKIDIEASTPSRQSQASENVVGEVKDVSNADAALEFLREKGDVPPMSAEDERRLKHKIDWRVVPLMFGAYIAQYLVSL